MPYLTEGQLQRLKTENQILGMKKALGMEVQHQGRTFVYSSDIRDLIRKTLPRRNRV